MKYFHNLKDNVFLTSLENTCVWPPNSYLLKHFVCYCQLGNYVVKGFTGGKELSPSKYSRLFVNRKSGNGPKNS